MTTEPDGYSGPDRREPDPIYVAMQENVQSLREGVEALANRVKSLSSALGSVNEVQQAQIEIGQQAVMAITEANRIDKEQQALAEEQARTKANLDANLVPKAVHEKRWRRENIGAVLGSLALVLIVVFGGLFLWITHGTVRKIQNQRKQSLVSAYDSCNANNDSRDGLRANDQATELLITDPANLAKLKANEARIPADTDCRIYQRQAKSLGVIIPTYKPMTPVPVSP